MESLTMDEIKGILDEETKRATDAGAPMVGLIFIFLELQFKKKIKEKGQQNAGQTTLTRLK